MPGESSVPTGRVEAVVHALHDRFGTAVEIAAITAQVEAEFAAYGDARVTDFVPILVTRRVCARFRSTTLV